MWHVCSYKVILDERITVEDLRRIDPVFYKSHVETIMAKVTHAPVMHRSPSAAILRIFVHISTRTLDGRVIMKHI